MAIGFKTDEVILSAIGVRAKVTVLAIGIKTVWLAMQVQ